MFFVMSKKTGSIDITIGELIQAKDSLSKLSFCCFPVKKLVGLNKSLKSASDEISNAVDCFNSLVEKHGFENDSNGHTVPNPGDSLFEEECYKFGISLEKGKEIHEKFSLEKDILYSESVNFEFEKLSIEDLEYSEQSLGKSIITAVDLKNLEKFIDG